MDTYDNSYCLKREAEERLAEAVASDPGAKDSHRRMAELYAARAWGVDERGLGSMALS